MKYLLNIHYMLSFHLLVIVIVILVAAWAVYESKTSTRLSLESAITDQRTYIKELLELTDRNAADETIASIIVDCPNRNQFERKLGNLAALRGRDLLDVQQFFESCGYYSSERKLLMVAKIEREFDILERYVTLLNELGETSQTDLAKLEILIGMEKNRADLLAELTTIQSDIISSLISGSTVSSDVVTDLVQRAGTINESLDVFNRQIDDARDSVLE